MPDVRSLVIPKSNWSRGKIGYNDKSSLLCAITIHSVIALPPRSVYPTSPLLLVSLGGSNERLVVVCFQLIVLPMLRSFDLRNNEELKSLLSCYLGDCLQRCCCTCA